MPATFVPPIKTTPLTSDELHATYKYKRRNKERKKEGKKERKIYFFLSLFLSFFFFAYVLHAVYQL